MLFVAETYDHEFKQQNMCGNLICKQNIDINIA